MQKGYNLKLVTAQLTAFGLGNFLEDGKHLHELKKRTVCQNQLGSALAFDFNTISIYMAPPDEFSRNAKMYQHILTILEDFDVETFLNALEDSNNQHIIKYIKRVMDGNCANANTTVTMTTTTKTTPENPSSSCSMDTKLKAQVVSLHLKNADLTEFLRPHLVELCKNTKDLEPFILSLHQSQVISQNEADEFSRLPNFAACTKLYDAVGKTGYGEKLVEALQSSENGHIIEKLYEWISS